MPLDTIMLMAGCKTEEFALHNIFEVSKEVGLYSDIHKTHVAKISKHMLPALLYDENSNPVVLIQLDDNEATVFDGSSNGIVKRPVKELAKSFKQVIYFFRDKTDKELIDIEDKSRAWFYQPVKESWRGYVEIAILTVFINVFVLAVPLYTMSVYDRVVPNFATSTLKVLAIGVVMILLFDIIFKSVRNYIVENIGKNISNRLEEELLKKMLTVQMKYDDMLAGAKVNLFRELNHIRELFASKTMINIMDFPFFLFLLLIIYIISPTIALIPAIGAVVIISFNILMQIPIQNIRKENYKNIESKNSFLVETIQGNESIRLTNATAKKLFEWRQLIAFTNQLSLRMQMFNAFAMNSSYMIIQFIVLLTIFVGVFEIHDKSLSIGGLIAVTILSSRVMVPIVNLSAILIKYKEFKEALDSLNRFWYLPQENSDKAELGIGALKGKIEFDKVDYYYKKSKVPAIKNFTLKIEHGEKVAIIGQTGAGKSTLLRMLTGLETPTSGKIHIDGHDIETLHNVEIRKNIGVMPQEPFLFSGTLKENIELSRNISKERLNEVISQTGLAALVKKQGKGESLQVGERGSNLSVGQRHLVALARTILQDPPILILDEPTTGLDIGLEKELTRHIKKIAEQKTLILITHRMAALELVDRVVVIKDGQVAVSGPRDKVMEYLKNPQQGKKSE